MAPVEHVQLFKVRFSCQKKWHTAHLLFRVAHLLHTNRGGGGVREPSLGVCSLGGARIPSRAGGDYTGGGVKIIWKASLHVGNVQSGFVRDPPPPHGTHFFWGGMDGGLGPPTLLLCTERGVRRNGTSSAEVLEGAGALPRLGAIARHFEDPM